MKYLTELAACNTQKSKTHSQAARSHTLKDRTHGFSIKCALPHIVSLMEGKTKERSCKVSRCGKREDKKNCWMKHLHFLFLVHHLKLFAHIRKDNKFIYVTSREFSKCEETHGLVCCPIRRRPDMHLVHPQTHSSLLSLCERQRTTFHLFVCTFSISVVCVHEPFMFTSLHFRMFFICVNCITTIWGNPLTAFLSYRIHRNRMNVRSQWPWAVTSKIISVPLWVHVDHMSRNDLPAFLRHRTSKSVTTQYILNMFLHLAEVERRGDRNVPVMNTWNISQHIIFLHLMFNCRCHNYIFSPAMV